MNNNYHQVVEQTHEEQINMYMKFSKKELCVMLIECNRLLMNIGSISKKLKIEKSDYCQCLYPKLTSKKGAIFCSKCKCRIDLRYKFK
jgi:hypothetical protein